METQLSLHDGIALGQIEVGLPTEPTPSAPEMRRLPTILRVLAAARPLSSVPAFGAMESSTDDDEDEVLNDAVRRLESRAAIYSVAEGVEVTAVHLAPAVCRKISKLRPLRTMTRETEDLLLARPSNAGAMVIDEERDDSLSGEEDLEQPAKDTITNRANPRRSSVDPRLAIQTQGEDSQEANVVRILAELSSLVVQSLKPPKKDDDELTDWSISMEESILAEPGSKVDKNVGGAMVSSDLGATVVSLMHHAAVLRHDHVACALCRAAVPQTPSLIARMGANAPTAIPTLVRGCIQAYEKASQSRSKNHAIASSARQSIRSLASLSAREASRIRSMLEGDGVMIDVQFELSMKHDSLLALCLLTDSLSLRNEMSTQDHVVAPDTCSEKEGPSRFKMRTMIDHLTESSTLLAATIEFLVDDLLTLVDDDVTSRISWTRLSFTLSALSLIFLRIPAENILSIMNVTKQDALLELLKKLRTIFAKQDSHSAYIGSNPFHRFYSLLVCCHLSYFMVLCSSDMANNSSREEAVNSLRDTLQIGYPSQQSEAIATAVHDCFCYNSPHDLCSVLFQMLFSSDLINSELPPWFLVAVVDKAEKTCQWLTLNFKCTFSEKSRDKQHIESEIYRVLRIIRQNRMVSEERIGEDCTRLLNIIFTDESLCSGLLLCSAIPGFIRLSVKLLHVENLAKIPLVLPLQVQSLASDFLQTHRSSVLSPSGARFLLMVLYCFDFLEAVPDTPFAVDLGAIPLREIYGLCLTRSKPIMSNNASDKILFVIERLAPDVPFWNQVSTLGRQSGRGVITKNELCKAMELGLKEKEDDIAGLTVEKVFLTAAGCLSDADLVTTAVNSLLSTALKCHVHYSYGVLGKDPLLVFKCASVVFEIRGFRRIALYVLSRLLDINDVLTRGMMKDRYSEAEYISARNCIVLHCLCRSLSNESVSDRCMLSTGLIRRLVASQEGLAAMVVKQVLDDVVVDCFCDAVPEAIDDWKSYLFILAERSTLTSAELLVVSSRVLRILVYQGLRLELESQNLLRAVLAHLIACFSAVVGPVGVPVSVIGEGTVADATKAAREASFRIIKTVGEVKAFRTELKNECTSSLQKLAAMCKSETPTSLPSSAAVRQKTILMETLEAIQQTAESLGIGLQV